MKKFLSIIIPKYKESEKEMFPLLSSINGQIGIDFCDIEVIIAIDGIKNGSNVTLDDNFLKMFNFETKQILLEKNVGPGVTRQAGINAAQGEYIMFCDADDTLHNVGVLGAFMQEAERKAPDIIYSSWLEEIKENDNYIYLTHENENTWMHGKLFRRHFLLQNNICFHENLKVHEDSYFLSIAGTFTERKIKMPFTSYVWKYNAKSITRKNNSEYTYKSVPDFIRAFTLSMEKIKTHAPDKIEYCTIQFVMYNYFTYQRKDWQKPENKKYRIAAEQEFSYHIEPFWIYFKNANAQKISEIYNQERSRVLTDGSVETELFVDWINRLGLK